MPKTKEQQGPRLSPEIVEKIGLIIFGPGLKNYQYAERFGVHKDTYQVWLREGAPKDQLLGLASVSALKLRRRAGALERLVLEHS